MPADVASFFASLMQDVAATAHASGELTRTAFVEVCAQKLVDAEAFQEWSPSYYEGRGPRRRAIAIDGYGAEELELDGTLHLLIADLRAGADLESLTSTDVKDAFGRACAFAEAAKAGLLEEQLEPSTPAADLARLIQGKGTGLRTLKVHVVSNGAIGSRFRQAERTRIDGMTAELHVWDLGRLADLADQGGREELEIDLAAFVPEGVRALPPGIGETGYSAYLAVLPGLLLARIYEEYGGRLLEGNVRAFLSAKGKVNKGIRKTLLNQPGMFFAFNNGITATATHVDVRHAKDACYIRKLKDLQIVNGGQTTASLFNALSRDKANLDGVFVQMKLSVLAAEAAEVMIPEISRYANTQNRVSDADLFANSPFHRVVEEISRRIWAPAKPGSQHMTHWFYERARAQYQAALAKLKGAERKKFEIQNPDEQKIDKEELALYENTWRMLPHVVSLGAQKNFVKYAEEASKAYEEQPESINDRWFQHLVAKGIVFQSTERLVSTAPWYPNGYRRNIVTYGIAKCIHLLKKKFPGCVIDLDRIWRAQRVSDTLLQQLAVCAQAASEIVSAPPAPWKNVTEWAKKEELWNRVVELEVSLVPGIEAELKAIAEEREESRDARVQAMEDKAISATVAVTEHAAAGTWVRALRWPRARRLLSGVEHALLLKAATTAAWVPSDLQAKRLMQGLQRLIEDGFE